MYLLYSILLSLAFLAMTPLFLLRREKYASGFSQRLGNYPEFKHDGRDVIWLHCVSVGETNAARPLVDALRTEFPDHCLVVSTTTRTGQELAQKIFVDKADAVVYFPFDFKFSVERALAHFKPSLVLLMETEIWPRFIHEAHTSGAKVAIVNGRLSQRSFKRYSRVRSFVRRVLHDVDLALMQNDPDADRIVELGIANKKIAVTGNLKFEQTIGDTDSQFTEEFRDRFNISREMPLIIAASTHEPEERYVLESLDGLLGHSCRLMVVPRHPERFDAVEKLLRASPYRFVRRSSPPAEDDRDVEIIFLDTIGELRSAYPLAEIVFVGGSLIPHGGQSILEPAVEGKAIVTGPYTANFDAVMREFLDNDALRQTPTAPDEDQISERLYEEFVDLLNNDETRKELGRRALALMNRANRNATARTMEFLHGLMQS
jgi:3-deoxy-D-manno-octulosonic-acid transferase